MFKLLLDEHIYPPIAERVRAKFPEAKIESLHFWQGGKFMQHSDERIVQEARKDGSVLLTFDLATIPPLLAAMAGMEEPHSGVIFVSRKSFAQNDHGGLVNALVACWPDWENLNWENRVEFLQRG